MLEVLRSKHLEACPELDASINRYMGVPPTLVPMDIMEDTVTEVG